MDIIREGFQVMVIGMGLVFFVLFSLSLILKFFSTFLYKQEEKNNKKKAKNIDGVKETGKVKDLEEEIAVISAVMADILDENECIINIRPAKNS